MIGNMKARLSMVGKGNQRNVTDDIHEFKIIYIFFWLSLFSILKKYSSFLSIPDQGKRPYEYFTICLMKTKTGDS